MSRVLWKRLHRSRCRWRHSRRRREKWHTGIYPEPNLQAHAAASTGGLGNGMNSEIVRSSWIFVHFPWLLFQFIGFSP